MRTAQPPHRSSGQAEPGARGFPTLTIIVPSFNRPAELQSTVSQLLRQHFRDFQMVVVDQSEGEHLRSNRAFFADLPDPRVQYRHVERKGLPNARNVGLAEATGSVVLFVDDDVILLSDRFIDAHLRCYDDPRVGGVTGRHVERALMRNTRRTACHVSWNGRTIFNLLGTERQEIGTCKGSNMSFRMAAVRSVGGFDRRTQMLEDADFSVRVAAAGWRLLFEPAAEVVHLSAPAGGVRQGRGLPTECRRFQSTAYYVGKHRGLLGRACFVLTFGLIALDRATRLRSFGVLPALARAVAAGFAQARLPPDQRLSAVPG